VTEKIVKCGTYQVPSDGLKEFKSDIWRGVEGFDGVVFARYVVPNFASNCVVVEAQARVTVISPGKSLLDSFIARHPELLESEGAALDIVMPNGYHYMGVESWMQVFPNARLFASKQAIKRLSTKGLTNVLAMEPNTKFMGHSASSGSQIQGKWVIPPGHRGGDVWLVLDGRKGLEARDGWLWITCDSFLNYPRVSNQPIARFMQRALGAAPGLKLSQVIKYLLLTDKKSFRAWCIDFIAQCPPRTLLPSHGDPRSSESLSLEIEQLVRKRL